MTDDYEQDDDLALRLGWALAQIDPVPADVVAAAKASGAWRSFDTELASLMYDSALASEELVGLRGTGCRLLSFASPDVTIEVEVDGGGRGLIGQITGIRPIRLEVCSGEGSLPVEPDAVGHFTCRSVRRGPVSVRATDDTGAVVHTEWVVI